MELWKAGDERLSRYERWELVRILQEPAYHSPEPSPERPTVNAASVGGENGNEAIKVYDIAERSVEVSKNVWVITTEVSNFAEVCSLQLRNLLRFLEKHQIDKTKAKFSRKRIYDDENQVVSSHLPRNAPSWCRRQVAGSSSD